MSAQDEEGDRLLGELIDGDPTPADAARFAELVHRDAVLRSRYLAWCELHALLQWEHGVLGGQVLPVPPRHRHRPGRILTILAMAACLAIAATVAIRWRIVSEPPPSEPIVAVPAALLDALQDCRWSTSGAPAPGTMLAQGRELAISTGSMSLTFTCGAIMAVEGPARLTLDSPWHATLHQGIARIHVPPQAIGFRVVTPHVGVVDLGTRFGLVVEPDRCDLLVVGGSIKATTLRSASHAEETLVLHRDESRSFHAGGHRPVADQTALRSRIDRIVQTTVTTMPAAPFLRWSLDEPTGIISMAVDGDGRTRPEAAARWTSQKANPPSAIIGRCGGAMHFAGGTHAEINLPGIAEPLPRTIACWVRLPEDGPLTNGNVFLSWDRRDRIQGIPHAAWMGWNLDPTQGPLGALRTAFGRTVLVGSTSLRDGRWHHVAVAMAPDGPEGALLISQYVDGRLDGRAFKAAPMQPLRNADAKGRPYRDVLLVARDPRASDFAHFIGDLDEITVVDRTLTQAEVAALMNISR